MNDANDAKNSEQIRKDLLPRPEECGFEVSFEENNLVVKIRKRFDAENSGRSWAKPIIQAYPVPFTTLIIDFGTNQIISSSVYAGLIELYQSFHSRCEQGVHLRNCSEAIVRALKMLHIDSFFTVHEQVKTEAPTPNNE